MRQLNRLIIAVCFILLSISIVGYVPAMADERGETSSGDAVANQIDKTSGTERFGNYVIKWNYDEAAKTLSFTGKSTVGEGDYYFEDDKAEDYSFFTKWYDAGLKEGKYYYDWQYFTETETVIFSEGITSIGTMACMGMRNLTKVELPTTLQTINSHAFRGCTSLRSVTIPDGAKNIGIDVFRDCQNLETVNLSETIKVVSAGMFENCKQLKTVKIPQSVKYVYGSAFAYSGLEKIVIPKNVVKIEVGAFEGCKQLKNVQIKGNKLVSVGSRAFKGCTSLKSIKFPKHIEEINSEAFAYSGLKKLVLPVELGSIGYQYGNGSWGRAFQGCKKLKEITFKGTKLPQLVKNTFKGLPKDCVIKVPKKKLKEYKKLFRKKGLSKKVKVKGI